MRAEKQCLLDEIKEKIESSKGFIVANYRGLTAMQFRAFRDKLVEQGGEFEVVQKRVFMKALQASSRSVSLKEMTGHVGVIFAYKDIISLAKDTIKYSSENEDAISFLVGHIDGEYYAAEEIETLTKLPSLAQLRSQVLGLFGATCSQMVGSCQAVLSSVLFCLEGKVNKE